MCEPTTMILSTLLSIGQSVVDFSQQQQAAKQQAAAARQQAINLRRQTAQRYSENLARLARERATASLKIQKDRETGLKAQARARVASGEAGFNFAPLQRDIGGEAAHAREEVRQAHADRAHETALRNESARLGLKSGLDAIPKVRGPGAVGLGFDIAGDLLTFSQKFAKH